MFPLRTELFPLRTEYREFKPTFKLESSGWKSSYPTLYITISKSEFNEHFSYFMIFLLTEFKIKKITNTSKKCEMFIHSRICRGYYHIRIDKSDFNIRILNEHTFFNDAMSNLIRVILLHRLVYFKHLIIKLEQRKKLKFEYNLLKNIQKYMRLNEEFL